MERHGEFLEDTWFMLVLYLDILVLPKGTADEWLFYKYSERDRQIVFSH